MIAHKFPGIQLDLSSVEVIWLHFTRFFMDLEANFDSSMHVFKEPTGVYYKLTGNFSPKILEEAKQKTISYVQKNKIEMLTSELEYKHYMNICQELRQRFPKIYIQLLHYNVFDYVSRRLHQKFGYKQALQDYQELIKKKKRFCYLICDKAYFPQIKEIFYQLADPIEKQTASLRRTTSTASVPIPPLQQAMQQNLLTHNRSSSTVVSNMNNQVNPLINISNQDEINIHNFDSCTSPRLAMGLKNSSYYEEEDDYGYGNNAYNQYGNQVNVFTGEQIENYKGLDIQKEDFPCLSDAQLIANQQQLLNDSNTSSNGGSNTKNDASKKKNKKQKKKQQQAAKQQANQQQIIKTSSSGITESYQKEQQSLQKAISQQISSSQYGNQYSYKNEQFDEWDFELPTYKQGQGDHQDYPEHYFTKSSVSQTGQTDKQLLQLQPKLSDPKTKLANQQSDQKNQNLNSSLKKDPLSVSQSNTVQQPIKKNSGSGLTTQQLAQQKNTSQPLSQQKSSSNQVQQSSSSKVQGQNEQGAQSSTKQNKNDKNEGKEQQLSQRSSEDQTNEISYEGLRQKQQSSQKNTQGHHQHSFSSDYQNQQLLQQQFEQQKQIHTSETLKISPLYHSSIQL